MGLADTLRRRAAAGRLTLGKQQQPCMASRQCSHAISTKEGKQECITAICTVTYSYTPSMTKHDLQQWVPSYNTPDICWQGSVLIAGCRALWITEQADDKCDCRAGNESNRDTTGSSSSRTAAHPWQGLSESAQLQKLSSDMEAGMVSTSL